MINHARNLLLNRAPTGNTILGRLGEEFIDPDYRPVANNQLENIRRILFGTEPDTWTVNYRATQYMAVLHSNVRAVPYVLDLDPRTTYRSGRIVYDTDFGCFIQNATASYDPPYKASFSSVWLGDDDTGHNFYEYNVRLSTTVAGNCYVERLNPYLKITIPQVTDQSIALTGTDTSFVIKNYASAANTDITWSLRVIAKPRRTLSQVADALQESHRVLDELWTANTMSYMTEFRNLFYNGRDPTHRLSGVLLTVIYYQEHLRGLE